MPAPPLLAADLIGELPAHDLLHILALFRTDLHRLTAAIEAAAAAADLPALRRAAHGLAGAAGSLGAADLEAACRRAMAAPSPAHAPEIRTLADAADQGIDDAIARITPQ